MKPIKDPQASAGGKPLPYSAGVVAGGALYLSGQIALVDGKIVGEDIASQTNLIFDSVERLLAEAGLGLADIVKTTAWLTRAEDFAEFNTAYAARLSPPYPARSTVVSQLVIADALIELEFIARAEPGDVS